MTSRPKVGEFHSRHPDGRLRDAHIHEPILQAGDNARVLRATAKRLRRQGWSEEDIRLLYGHEAVG